jgi:hypothetical protein
MYWIAASIVKTSLFLVPQLEVGYKVGPFYAAQISSAECSPQTLKLWNPQTATWIVESGLDYQGVKIFVGHKSYHSVDSVIALKSYDYAGISFRKEFK